ncbi:EfeM/EfeO family lipoprotein [Aneurinibacillus sp. BA2021]|nr:EfeM/EfeO family lipoprotein [Aneurinibacillus sp. BA2021]
MRKRYAALLSFTVSCSLALAGCSASNGGDASKEDKASQEANAPAQAAAPVSDAEIQAAIAKYKEYVLQQSDQLVTSTTQFVQAVKAGEIEKAKELYAPSRQYFERIEPVAESFGNLDPDIDARDTDVPAEEFKGFHHIERALWKDNTTKGEEKVADELLNNVKLLRAKVETFDIDPVLFVTGPVGLLNEVSTSKVTGEEERYSHTDFYDFAANVEGAEKIYTLLKPILQKQDANLSASIEQRFADLNTALAAHKKGNKYVSYDTLSKDQMRQLSQSVDAVAEPLSQIGVVLGVQGNGNK